MYVLAWASQMGSKFGRSQLVPYSNYNITSLSQGDREYNGGLLRERPFHLKNLANIVS